MDELFKTSEQMALFCRLMMNVKKDIPIRSSEMGLLIYLVKTEEEHTPLAASKYFKVTKGMITNMVTSLAKKGYLIKNQSEADKRSCILVPTKQAVKLVNETYDENFRVMYALQSGLGVDDLQKLTELLERANDILWEVKNG